MIEKARKGDTDNAFELLIDIERHTSQQKPLPYELNTYLAEAIAKFLNEEKGDTKKIMKQWASAFNLLQARGRPKNAVDCESEIRAAQLELERRHLGSSKKARAALSEPKDPNAPRHDDRTFQRDASEYREEMVKLFPEELKALTLRVSELPTKKVK